MPDRRPLRHLLVVANLMLVLAPHVAHADRELTRQTDPKIEPAPNTHHAPGKVRPEPQPSPSPSPSPSPRTRTTSQPADDDDSGGEAAGEIASACCAGMIGAMAEPSTPEDVDLPPMPEEPDEPPIAYGAGGAHPTPPAGDSGAPASAPFDRRAADRELSAANTRALERCGPSDYEVAARVTFHPSGEPFDVTFTPTGFTNTEHGRCVEGKLLEARIPPFAGAPTTVDRALTLD